MKNRINRLWAPGLLALVLLVGGYWVVTHPTLLGLPANLPVPYAAEPGESKELLSIADYFETRYTYPTGNFSQSWLVEAAEQARQIEAGLPDGQHPTTKGDSPTALNMDPAQFTHLGPAPLQSNGCQNCFSYGHVNGRVETIVSDPVDPTIAYFGTDGGGIWKTTNCCSTSTTWTYVTEDEGLYGLAIDDITLDPNDHSILYAATGDLNFGSFSFGTVGVLKSTDFGESWELLGTDVFTTGYPLPSTFPQYQALGKVRVDPNDSNKVIVGSKTGLFFSYDAGVNWTGPCLTNAYTSQRQDITGLLVRDMGTETRLYAAVGTRGFNTTVQPDLNLNGANAVYSTTIPASGCPASWDLLNNGWPAGTGGGVPYPTNTMGRIELAMAPSNPDVIYAQVATSYLNQTNQQLGVWKTTNGGSSWTMISGPSGPGGCDGPGAQSWYNQIMAVDPNNSDVLYMGTIDQFRSTNGGTSFTNVSCGYAGGSDLHVDQHALAYVGGSSSVLLVGNDGGIYVTLNADAANVNSVVFNQLNDSVSTLELYSGDITNNFSYAAQPGANAGAQDNGSSTYVWTSGIPGPAMWQLRTGGDGMFARIEQKLGQRWYQTSQYGSLKVSTTGPSGTYSVVSGGWSGDTVSFVLPYELDKFDCPNSICDHMIAGTHRVWETILGAVPSSSWYINSTNLTKGTLGNRSFINQLSYSPLDNAVAIVGTNDGNVQIGRNLGTGVANQAIWVNVTDSNTVLPNRPILDVAMSHADQWVGFAAVGGFNQNTPTTPGHVFKVTCSENCATFTWEDKTGNLPNVPADSILSNPNIPAQVFVGTDWGLYYTNNINAATPVWQHFTAGLPAIMIWDMAVDRDGTTLAVFTRSRGAYVWPLPVTVNYSAEMTPAASTQTLPGLTVTHTFTLTTTGLDDSYTLAIQGANWPTTLLTTSPITIPSGNSDVVSIQVDIPLTASLGQSDAFELVATSTHAPSVVLTGLGTTTVTGAAGVAMTGDQTAAAEVGETVTYTVQITNTGEVTDSFDLTLGTSAWTVTSSASGIGPLGPGQTATVEIYVTVGAGASDSVTVTATSQFDPTASATTTLTTTAIIPGNAGVTLTGDQTGAAEVGETVTYTVQITNTGTVTDSFAISLGTSAWTVSSSTTQVGPLGPGQTATVEIYVTVGAGASDRVDVTVTSQHDPTVSATATLTTTAILPPLPSLIYLPLLMKP
jgi:hypothetical protein